MKAAGCPLWILDDAPIMGGAEGFALRLARWIARSTPRRELVILCPAGSELARRAVDSAITVQPVDFPPPALPHAPSAAIAVARLHRLLGASHPSTLLLANAARAQAYTLLASRGLRPARRLVSLMHEQDSAQRRSVRLALPRAGGVCAIGETTASVYRAALPGATVWAVDNFLDPEQVEREVGSRCAPPVSERPVVGALSRMYPGKGLLELVDELAEVLDAWSLARLAAPFQDPRYTSLVRARIDQHGLHERIELMGEVDDVGGYLDGISHLVVPSTATEGQPTVILEALARGRPVLVRRHVWQRAYLGLPVAPYSTAGELGDALTGDWPVPVAAAELLARFDPAMALTRLERAARA